MHQDASRNYISMNNKSAYSDIIQSLKTENELLKRKISSIKDGNTVPTGHRREQRLPVEGEVLDSLKDELSQNSENEGESGHSSQEEGPFE